MSSNAFDEPSGRKTTGEHRGGPAGRKPARGYAETIAAVVRALAQRGIEITEDGVRLTKPKRR